MSTTRGGSRRIRKRIVTRDGASLAVSDWPAAAAADRTVVFLHGLCLNQESWGIQRRHLLRRFGHHTRIISYDHRGHGESGSAPTHTYTIPHLADDLSEVLTALDVRGPVILVGHSMGAMTALQYLTHTNPAADVAGLVVCAAAAGGLCAHGAGRLLELPAVSALVEAVAHIPERAAGALTMPLRVAMRQLREHGGVRSGAIAAVVTNALETTPLSTAVGFLGSLRQFDLTHTLHTITAPTTILSGGADLLTPPVLSRQMAESIPTAGHVHLPLAGHMLPQMESRAVNTAIAAAVAGAAPLRSRRRTRRLTAVPTVKEVS